MHLSAVHSISLLLTETDQLIVLGDFNIPNISGLESKDSLAMIPRTQHNFIDGLNYLCSKLTGLPIILVVFLT